MTGRAIGVVEGAVGAVEDAAIGDREVGGDWHAATVSASAAQATANDGGRARRSCAVGVVTACWGR